MSIMTYHEVPEEDLDAIESLLIDLERLKLIRAPWRRAPGVSKWQNEGVPERIQQAISEAVKLGTPEGLALAGELLGETRRLQSVRI